MNFATSGMLSSYLGNLYRIIKNLFKKVTNNLCPDYLVPVVQDGGHRGGDTQQYLKHFGQVDVDEVAQFMNHHIDDVQQAVLTAQRQDGTQICLSYCSVHRCQAGT